MSGNVLPKLKWILQLEMWEQKLGKTTIKIDKNFLLSLGWCVLKVWSGLQKMILCHWNGVAWWVLPSILLLVNSFQEHIAVRGRQTCGQHSRKSWEKREWEWGGSVWKGEFTGECKHQPTQFRGSHILEYWCKFAFLHLHQKTTASIPAHTDWLRRKVQAGSVFC